VSCWGEGSYGKLGDGTLNTSAIPQPTLLPASATALSASTGDALPNSDVGFLCALDVTGAVLCWGSDQDGAFARPPGSGPGVTVATPLRIEGVPTVARLSTGGDHVCVVEAQGGIWCWGSNSNGQLGDGTISGFDSPRRIDLAPATMISAGGQHTCALRFGAVWCWGANAWGQLGDGTTEDRHLPTRSLLSCP
jgi:alpha-tubulin suppressor-like RCC1 family protein